MAISKIGTNSLGNVTDVSSSTTLSLKTAGTTAITVDASQNVGIGTASPSTKLTVRGDALKIEATTGEGGPFIYRAGGNAPDVRFYSSNGTIDSPTALSNGSLAGQLHFQAHDGTSYLDRAGLYSQVDTSVSTGSAGVALRFLTGITGTVDRLRISSSGDFSSTIPSGNTLYPSFWCRSWVNFGASGTLSIRGSGNVSSVSDEGSTFYINFSTSLPDGNFAAVADGEFGSSNTSFEVGQFSTGGYRCWVISGDANPTVVSTFVVR